MTVKVAAGLDRCSVATRKRLQFFRQLVWFGHCGPIDQNRNQMQFPLKRSLKLDSDKIVFIVYATVSQPMWADNGKYNVAIFYLSF
ncbi:MAG TPA: hypothetical protein VF601_13665 [Beijerinckiaceae bacterium]|jgi:hypothetical protein